jgi:hypothetical protein
MKPSLLKKLKKWERYASEERRLRRKAAWFGPNHISARIELTLAQVALNRVERAIARAAYLEAFGVKPTVALVTRKRGGQ